MKFKVGDSVKTFTGLNGEILEIYNETSMYKYKINFEKYGIGWWYEKSLTLIKKKSHPHTTIFK